MDIAKRARLLIIDDEPAIRTSLQAYLSDLDYIADGAESAEQAIGLLRDSSYDLLIVDLRLPGMSGEQLIRRVHAQRDGTRFLIHTGSMGYRLSDELRQLGLTERHIFAKPVIDLQQLVTRIEQQLSLS